MHCVLGCKVILSDYKDSWVIVRPSPLIEKGLPAMLGAFFYQWRYAPAGQALLLLNPSQLR